MFNPFKSLFRRDPNKLVIRGVKCQLLPFGVYISTKDLELSERILHYIENEGIRYVRK